MKKVVVGSHRVYDYAYVAADGTRFKESHECEEYEKTIKISEYDKNIFYSNNLLGGYETAAIAIVTDKNDFCALLRRLKNDKFNFYYDVERYIDCYEDRFANHYICLLYDDSGDTENVEVDLLSNITKKLKNKIKYYSDKYEEITNFISSEEGAVDL